MAEGDGMTRPSFEAWAESINAACAMFAEAGAETIPLPPLD